MRCSRTDLFFNSEPGWFPPSPLPAPLSLSTGYFTSPKLSPLPGDAGRRRPTYPAPWINAAHRPGVSQRVTKGGGPALAAQAGGRVAVVKKFAAGPAVSKNSLCDHLRDHRPPPGPHHLTVNRPVARISAPLPGTGPIHPCTVAAAESPAIMDVGRYYDPRWCTDILFAAVN